jgi:para-aminobenzoate synthetase component I
MNFGSLEIDIAPDHIAAVISGLPADRYAAILDSSGVRHLGSHLMIAGLDPVERIEIKQEAAGALSAISAAAESGLAAIFTLSYDLGNALLQRPGSRPVSIDAAEPFAWISVYDHLVIHDYSTGKTSITGNTAKLSAAADLLIEGRPEEVSDPGTVPKPTSNFTRDSYIAAVELIQEHIRRGDTYQVNLTQQLAVDLGREQKAKDIFLRLRRDHPAPFAAFIRRDGSTVISASPERFFSIRAGRISASPIKGTRKRSDDPSEDAQLRNELLASDKDRAENTMIVDLLRNDLGRVCEFGTVRVEKLCDLEEHPTLFHLVSTISGRLAENISFADVLDAVFPCGSITGAPKIRTMELIEEIEPGPRGLSMGAIGYSIPAKGFGFAERQIDLSVAIRTMVVRDGKAVFNVGGGIVIDSDAATEYEESLLKAKALLTALGCKM